MPVITGSPSLLDTNLLISIPFRLPVKSVFISNAPLKCYTTPAMLLSSYWKIHIYLNIHIALKLLLSIVSATGNKRKFLTTPAHCLNFISWFNYPWPTVLIFIRLYKSSLLIFHPVSRSYHSLPLSVLQSTEICQCMCMWEWEMCEVMCGDGGHLCSQ